jgi:diguanylate cyclase (GGDEF)-like protein
MQLQHEHVTILCQLERTGVPDFLRDGGYRVIEASAGCELTVAPDLIMTDRPISEELREQFEPSLRMGTIGWIAIGSKPVNADAGLSETPTRAEVLTAVELTAEIVRLRRRLVSEQAEKEVLASWAMTDPLTGLANRRAWNEQLRWRLSQPNSLCLALFDLDHFKLVNDAAGHAVGDRVLREAADAMRGRLRDQDLLARLGGDEFGMLISNIDQNAAAAVVDRIRENAAESVQEQGLPAITMSAGYIVSSPNQARDPDQLFAAASRNLMSAKRISRDCTFGHGG